MVPTRITVTHNAGDLNDFLSDNENASGDLVSRRMDAYVARHAHMLREWYPDVRIVVDYGETPMGTTIVVEPHEEREDVISIVDEAASRVVSDWDWCPEN
jgi:hypothetical protein